VLTSEEKHQQRRKKIQGEGKVGAKGSSSYIDLSKVGVEIKDRVFIPCV